MAESQRQTYFNDAKDNLLKELVEFNSREDFDRFMGNVENSYFEKVVSVSKDPYNGHRDAVPQWPPKPFSGFQDQRNRTERSRSPVQKISKKSFDNFVDTVSNLNNMRGATGELQSEKVARREREVEQENRLKAQRSREMEMTRQDQFNQPFFQSFVQKKNSSMTQQLRRAGRPLSPDEVAHGGFDDNQTLKSFVAGQTIMERNPMSEPLSMVGNSQYNMAPVNAQRELNNIKSQIEERNFDINNPDTQYLRYKQMINSQYYNLQANSGGQQASENARDTRSRYGAIYGDTKKTFEVPHHFKLSEIQAKQRSQAMQNFNPGAPDVQLDPTQQRMLKPHTVSIYSIPENQAPQRIEPNRPEFYRSIQMNTKVEKGVIDSLGGIVDTVKPMEASLKMHEMRPFDIEPNYYEDLLISQNKLRPKNFDSFRGDKEDFTQTKSEFLKKTLNEQHFAQNNGTIVSASPYRAVIRRRDFEDYEKPEEVSQLASPESEDRGPDIGLEDEIDQFDRNLDGMTLIDNRFKDTYTTGRVVDNDHDFFQNEERIEVPETLNTAVTKDHALDALSQKSKNTHVNEDSHMMRQSRTNFLKQFNDRRAAAPPPLPPQSASVVAPSRAFLNINHMNVESGPSLVHDFKTQQVSPVPETLEQEHLKKRIRPVSQTFDLQAQNARNLSQIQRGQREEFLNRFK